MIAKTGTAEFGSGKNLQTHAWMIAFRDDLMPKNRFGKPIEAIGAGLAILLALAAGILGYRIIRGGRGL